MNMLDIHQVAQLPFEFDEYAPEYGQVTLIKNVADNSYEINDSAGNYFGEISFEDLLSIRRTGDVGIMIADIIREFESVEKPNYEFVGKESANPLLCNKKEYMLFKITRDSLKRSTIGLGSDQAVEMSGLSKEKYMDCLERQQEYEETYSE